MNRLSEDEGTSDTYLVVPGPTTHSSTSAWNQRERIFPQISISSKKMPDEM